ncbi:uncharacterized protein LOC111056430 [Nilaparvata lugens]|uniref:uncharacterized protein LOC111056430 n=1 Tax=Nilaparvata lugens TaxID=108931 RepID=UPI00193D9294|nr:uncharacterized protein LOC111056430 [Nilaparvata lugens]
MIGVKYLWITQSCNGVSQVLSNRGKVLIEIVANFRSTLLLRRLSIFDKFIDREEMFKHRILEENLNATRIEIELRCSNINQYVAQKIATLNRKRLKYSGAPQ